MRASYSDIILFVGFVSYFLSNNCLTIHRVEQMGPSVHEFARSSVDKDQGMVKKSSDGPADGSPSRRFWKLVKKKTSINGLREKKKIKQTLTILLLFRRSQVILQTILSIH